MQNVPWLQHCQREKRRLAAQRRHSMDVSRERSQSQRRSGCPRSSTICATKHDRRVQLLLVLQYMASWRGCVVALNIRRAEARGSRGSCVTSRVARHQCHRPIRLGSILHLTLFVSIFSLHELIMHDDRVQT